VAVQYGDMKRFTESWKDVLNKCCLSCQYTNVNQSKTKLKPMICVFHMYLYQPYPIWLNDLQTIYIKIKFNKFRINERFQSTRHTKSTKRHESLRKQRPASTWGLNTIFNWIQKQSVCNSEKPQNKSSFKLWQYHLIERSQQTLSTRTVLPQRSSRSCQ
jgi:hypothetical protein